MKNVLFGILVIASSAAFATQLNASDNDINTVRKIHANYLYKIYESASKSKTCDVMYGTVHPEFSKFYSILGKYQYLAEETRAAMNLYGNPLNSPAVAKSVWNYIDKKMQENHSDKEYFYIMCGDQQKNPGAEQPIFDNVKKINRDTVMVATKSNNVEFYHYWSRYNNQWKIFKAIPSDNIFPKIDSTSSKAIVTSLVLANYSDVLNKECTNWKINSSYEKDLNRVLSYTFGESYLLFRKQFKEKLEQFYRSYTKEELERINEYTDCDTDLGKFKAWLVILQNTNSSIQQISPILFGR